MPEARRRPCSICRRWFRPDPRVGVRQRACHQPECQATRRKKTQAAWCDRNPGYFAGRRILARSALAQPPEALRLPDPLRQLPWDIAQDQFGVKGADFIAVMGALLLRAAQDQLRPYQTDSTALTSALMQSVLQDQMPPPP